MPVPDGTRPVAGLGSPYSYVDRLHGLGRLDLGIGEEPPFVVRDGTVESKYFDASFLLFHGDSLVRMELASSHIVPRFELDSLVVEISRPFPIPARSPKAIVGKIEDDTTLRLSKPISGDSIIARPTVTPRTGGACAGYSIDMDFILASLEGFVDLDGSLH